MFEGIPSPSAPSPSQKWAITIFGVVFAVFLTGGVAAWIRWSRPFSLLRKLEAAEIIVCGVLSGVFLLAAKAATPEANRRRIAVLLLVVPVFQIINLLLQR
jgi:hypothetical protein